MKPTPTGPIQIESGDIGGVRNGRYHARDAGNLILFQGRACVEHVRRTRRAGIKNVGIYFGSWNEVVPRSVVTYRRGFALLPVAHSGLMYRGHLNSGCSFPSVPQSCDESFDMWGYDHGWMMKGWGMGGFGLSSGL